MGFFSKKNKENKELRGVDDLRGKSVGLQDADDTDAVISAYLPMRRVRLLGKALMRLDRVKLLLIIAIIIAAILFLLSFLQEKMGNFTINLDRLELYRKGIAISDEPYFINPTARLSAAPVQDATNITITDIPADVDRYDGSNNGTNYMAYSYYLRNAGKENVGYNANLILVSSSKGAHEAVRVAVWRNGVKTVYAKLAADGKPEPGTVPFVSDNVVVTYTVEDFLIGNVDRYTVVIWMEGEDPECVDKIVGGSVEFTMKFTSTQEEQTSLLQKYVRDIIDTIRGDDPINPAGTDAPEFTYRNVNWYTRRNQ
jgi:hypothetical protein